MDKRAYRDTLRFISALIFIWLYIPHIIIGYKNSLIKSDIRTISDQIKFHIPTNLQLLYQLHNNRYFRTIFYHRIGPVKSLFIEWLRPGDKYFNISATTKIGKAMWIAHPYATIINAEKIGDNFKCIHCTTIGATSNGRPIIGDNVTIGANVTIIGNIHIGDNVIIGAGSVVVKDIPDNCIAAGNPAKIIRHIK